MGRVFSAVHKDTGKRVAIKYIKNALEHSVLAMQLVREIQILRKLSEMDQDHATKIYDLFLYEDKKRTSIFIVMEYVENTLIELLDYSDNLELKEEHVVRLLYSLLCSLQFIHSANVLHRDIKPQNLLVDQNFNIKLCDFGLSRTVENVSAISPIKKQPRKEVGYNLVQERQSRRNTTRQLSPCVSSRWYRAPEVILLEK